MFRQKSEVDIFIAILADLVQASEGTTPKVLNQSAQKLLDRCNNFEGTTSEELICYILSGRPKPQAAKKPATKKRAKTKLRPKSIKLISEAVSALRESENDKGKFSVIADEYYKTCTAGAFKAIVAEYAASGLPSSKPKAADELHRARARRIRSDLKFR